MVDVSMPDSSPTIAKATLNLMSRTACFIQSKHWPKIDEFYVHRGRAGIVNGMT